MTMRFVIILMFSLGWLNVQAQTADSLEYWFRTELYFGLSKPDGGKVSKRQWNQFVKTEITPKFPDGSTILNATGNWLDSETKKTIKEPSKVVIICYQQSEKNKQDEALEAVSKKYIELFEQQAVMRVDGRVEVQFYSSQ